MSAETKKGRARRMEEDSQGREELDREGRDGGGEGKKRSKNASADAGVAVAERAPLVDLGTLLQQERMDAEANARRRLTQSGRRLIVVLEGACLETIKTRKGYELITADSHAGILKKFNKTAADFRPDIAHQCLLTLLDSPLNKAGLLKVFIHTAKNVLIDINPRTRIPRTFSRFCGLMVQLLHKLKIRASDGPDMLLKVIKNPITVHLPPGCRKIGTSVRGELVDMRRFVATLPPDEPVVVVVGAIAHGEISADYVERTIAVSGYPLSAAYCLSRILNSFEGHWGIL